MLFFVLTMNPLTRKSRCSCSCPDNLCICCTQRKLDDSWYDLLQRYSSWLYMATFCMVNIDIASWTDDGRSCVGTFSGFIYFEWWVIQTWWNVTIDRLTDWEDTYTSISVLLIHMCYVNGTIIYGCGADRTVYQWAQCECGKWSASQNTINTISAS